jgi:chromosome segregation ATPase
MPFVLVDLDSLAATRLSSAKSLQEETESLYDDLSSYQESNLLIAEAIEDVDAETKALEEEYDSLKTMIEEGKEAVAAIMVSSGNDNKYLGIYFDFFFFFLDSFGR